MSYLKAYSHVLHTHTHKHTHKHAHTRTHTHTRTHIYTYTFNIPVLTTASLGYVAPMYDECEPAEDNKRLVAPFTADTSASSPHFMAPSLRRVTHLWVLISFVDSVSGHILMPSLKVLSEDIFALWL